MTVRAEFSDVYEIPLIL